MWASVGLPRSPSAGPASVGEVLDEAAISCATFGMSFLLSCILACLLRVGCVQGVLPGPVVFYMLKKLGVPRTVNLVAFTPIEQKFGYLVPGKLHIYIGQP